MTVKTLHHYDRLGLLRPTRTDRGHRVYESRDLQRLAQIAALKGVGFSLRRIKALLASLPALPGALRAQRVVLEKRRLDLDHAVAAIARAERAIGRGEPPRVVLETLIEVLDMADDLAVMIQYFAEDACDQCRRYYEQWPSRDWRDLCREADGLIAKSDDPGDESAARLAARWRALIERETAGDRAFRAGWWRAWIDRDRWPASLQDRMISLKLHRVARFIHEASWELAEAERRSSRGTTYRAPDRASPSRLTLFRDIEAALAAGLDDEQAIVLATRWHALIERETQGDPITRAEVTTAWARRHQWPDGLRRYVASLYETDWATWNRVASFIEQADQGVHPLRS